MQRGAARRSEVVEVTPGSVEAMEASQPDALISCLLYVLPDSTTPLKRNGVTDYLVRAW